MKKNNRVLVFLVLSGLMLQGCATTANKRLDDKLHQENSVSSRTELKVVASDAIERAQELTPEQREKLTALRSATGAQLDEMVQQSLKLRAVLIKDLISPDYDMDEVDLIKKRLSDLEHRRLKVLFDAVSEANDIMGRKSTKNASVLEDFLGPRGNRD